MTERDKRYRRGLWLARLVSWTPPLIFVICVGVYLVSVGTLLKRNLPPLIASGAGLALHREVTVGSVSATHNFNEITLRDVAISDAPTFALGHGRKVASAPRVTVELDAAGLAHDASNAGAYIRVITIDRPVGYVQRRAGNMFNFSDLFKKPTAKHKSKPFAAVIRVNNGAVVFQDQLAPASYQPAINTLTHVYGNLSFAAPHEITFAATVNAAANRFRAAQVSGEFVYEPVAGQVNDKLGGYNIRINGQQANAAYFVGYFLQKPLKLIGKLTRGTGDVSLSLGQRNPVPKQPLDIAGVAKVDGGQFIIANRSLLSEPLDGIRGLLRFTGNSLSLNASATVDGMPIHAVGSIPSFKHPTINFHGSAPTVVAARVHSALPFVQPLPAWLTGASTASVVATATGPVTHAKYDVAFSARSASVYGVPVHAIRGGLTFQGKSLTLRSLIASTDGQSDNIALTGAFITTPHGASRLLGHATGIDLSTTHLPGNLRAALGGVSGIADADVQYASDGGAISAAAAAPLTVTARLRNGSLHGVPIDQAAVVVSATGSTAKISQLVVVQPNGGILSASGTTPLTPKSTSSLNLDVAASGVDVGQLSRQFGIRQLSGLAYFRGHVAGMFAAPRVTGRASVFNAAYGSYAVDHARADIAYTRDSVDLTGGTVQRLGVNARFAALVTGLRSRQPAIAASVSTHNAEIAALTLLASETGGKDGAGLVPASVRQIAATATGTLDADIQVSGALAKPRIAAQARIASATIASLQISRLQTAAELNGAQLAVRQLTTQVDGANIVASGTLNLSTKAVRATVQANSADLSRQAAAFGQGSAVTGSASAQALIAGTLGNPTAQLTATLANAKYKNVPINASEIALHYSDGRLENIAGAPLTVQSGPATYSLSSLDYDTRRRTIDLSAAVAGEQIARVVTLAKQLAPGNSPAASALQQLPDGLAGALEITSFQLSGPVAKPNARVAAAVHGLTFGEPGEDKLDVAADASYSGGTATLTSLEARGPVEYLSASGSLVPNGPLNAQLDASNFPLSFTHTIDPALPKIGGNLSDLTIVATGTASKPIVNASISLVDVSSGAVSVDRIDSGRITLANDRISIAGLSLVKNEQPPPGSPASGPVQHTALLQGYLPFQFSLKNGVKAAFPADGEVSLAASLPSQSVSLFTLFNPALKSLKLSGIVSANVNISGTLSQKTIQGSINVANAALQPAGFKTGLQNINVAARFNGQHGTITSSPVKSTDGGYLTLGGTVDVAQSTTGATYASASDALLGSLQLHLSADAVNFAVDEPKVAALYNAGGSGVINGNVQVNGALLTPLVQGSLKVTKAVGMLPTASPSTSAPKPQPEFNPTFQLAIAIAPGATVKSALLNATIDGAVQITHSLYQPDVEGDFNVRSGRLNFYTAIFRVVPTGSVHFSYNPPADVVERVDITATTSLNISPTLLAANRMGASSLTSGEPYNYDAGSVFSPVQQSGSQRYTITATIEGDLNRPGGLRSTFDSDPPGLTDEQILAALGGQQVLSSLLVGGNVQGALQTEAQQVFTGYALPTLLAPFESSVAQVFGLEEIDVDYEPESPLLISVIKKIGPRLDVRYTRYVNSRQESGAVGSTLTPLEYSVAVDYYFTNKFRFNVSTDDQHNTTFGVGGAVNF